MKVPFSWLQELVEITIPIDKLSESLSVAGFEVESIDDFSNRAQGVVVGYIKSIENHPNANKLKICHVNIEQQKTEQIVCGANNVKAGIHVLIAKNGAYLSAKNIQIKAAELRGVKSNGMICSLNELGFNASNNGIAILEEMEVEIPDIGTDVIKLLNLEEKVIDLAITANRPDGMSMIGIAREVSALTEAKLTIPLSGKRNTQLFKPNYKDITSVDQSGIYTLTEINNIDGSIKSSKKIIERLENSGIKSINSIVDITNYILLEQGQPLHAFDKDSLERISNKKVNSSSFGIRKARNKEKIKALDGKTYNLNSEITLITCHDIPVAIAGVIGEFNTSVNNNTKNIMLEGAIFTASSVRASSRGLGIRTESSSRYEKGISEQNTLPSIQRYLNILKKQFPELEESDTFVDKEIELNNQEILLRKSRINSILGHLIGKTESNKNIDKQRGYITDNDIEVKLKLLGCKIRKVSDNWMIKVPDYRRLDLLREIDLIEEIARLIGFDKFEANLPKPIQPGGLNKEQISERRIRNSLLGAGLQEVLTFSLVQHSDNDKERIAITNPLLADTSHLRTNLWEEHLNICNRNISSGKNGCWIFEIGSIYSKSNGPIKETKVLAGLITGEKRFEKWSTGGKPKNLNYFEARGLLQQTFHKLKIEIIDKPLKNDKILHPGRAAELFLEGKSIGKFGEINPSLNEKKDLNIETYLFELDLNSIIKASVRKNKYCVTYKKFPTVPSMERDIALIIDSKITSYEIASIIRKAGKPLLEDVELIDRYEGKNLEKGKVSQAFRITYRNISKTLTEADINPIHANIRKVLSEKLGAKLRS
tara:strand:+ start:915 stop:3386 length:2472 start_codon:yes stop_codon:yes gene_type:complete